MKTTILCSFDTVDFAELAAGRLRAKIPGIKNIEITTPPPEGTRMGGVLPFTAVGMATLGAPGGGSAGPIALPVYLGDADPDRHPEDDTVSNNATMRVTCAASRRREVEAQLINLGALHVRAFDELPPS